MNLDNFKECLEIISEDDLFKLKLIVENCPKIILLGNGGSNAISSHLAEDYTKSLNKQAISFSDSARLSCYANDFGWEDAYSKFVEHFAEKETLIILISSSGKSQNIINTAEYCKDKHKTIILTGFEESNPLRLNFKKHSLLEFWIPSTDYGIVEILHELILHSIL